MPERWSQHQTTETTETTETELSQADRDKWNARYAGGAYGTLTRPSALLARWLGHLGVPGPAPRAVDIAGGRGRNALFLARRGWRVDAVDISRVALEHLRAAAYAEGLPVRCAERDLEPTSSGLDAFEGPRYDLALMIRYTDTPLVEALPRILAPGGHLIAEMHLQTDAAVAGPRSPRFRVAAGELRKAGTALELLYYHEGLVTDPDGRTVALAQLVGRQPRTPAG